MGADIVIMAWRVEGVVLGTCKLRSCDLSANYGPSHVSQVNLGASSTEMDGYPDMSFV